MKAKKPKQKDVGFRYDPQSKVYKDAKAGKDIQANQIKNATDVASAIMGILHSK